MLKTFGSLIIPVMLSNSNYQECQSLSLAMLRSRVIARFRRAAKGKLARSWSSDTFQFRQLKITNGKHNRISNWKIRRRTPWKTGMSIHLRPFDKDYFGLFDSFRDWTSCIGQECQILIWPCGEAAPLPGFAGLVKSRFDTPDWCCFAKSRKISENRKFVTKARKHEILALC